MDFDKIYLDYYDQVKRTAKSYLRHEEDALDVAQDTFLKVYESLDSYDDSYSLSTWVTEICINKCKDKLRQRKRERQRFAPITGANEHLLDSREDQNTPDSILSAEEDGVSIADTFSSLPDNIRQAMTLRFSDELSYREVAEKMGVPLSTVKTWVRRGRSKLMQQVSPQ